MLVKRDTAIIISAISLLSIVVVKNSIIMLENLKTGAARAEAREMRLVEVQSSKRAVIDHQSPWDAFCVHVRAVSVATTKRSWRPPRQFHRPPPSPAVGGARPIFMAFRLRRKFKPSGWRADLRSRGRAFDSQLRTTTLGRLLTPRLIEY